MTAAAPQPVLLSAPFRRLNRLFEETFRLSLLLAFWALWHCRHARPPDVFLGY